MSEQNPAPNTNDQAPAPDPKPSVPPTPKSLLKTKPIKLIIPAILLLLAGIAIAAFILPKPSFAPQKTTPLPQAKQIKTGPLKIGGIIPLTGDAASFGIPIQQSVYLAQKEINESGGINGRQIEVIFRDGRCEKQDAKTAAEQLINEEKVELLLGGACSDEFLSSAPIAQSEKVITFSSTATSPEISELGKYVFRTCPSDALAGKAAAGYAYNKWGAKTAGVIAEDKDYSQALKEVFSQNFTQLGGEVVMTETFPTGTTDFSDLAGKAKSLSPDVLYILPQSSTPGVLLVKALKDQGVASKILTAEVLLISDAVTEQGEILEGVTGIQPFFDETRPKTQKFLELYKKEFNLEPGYPADLAGVYDFMYLIKEAYEAVGSDPDKVSQYLYSLENWDGAVGDLSFDKNGDPTLIYSIRQITGFEALQVDSYSPEE